MPTFGLRPDDLLRDSRGDVMIDVPQTFYASRTDAEMQQNALGSVTTRKDGRWEFTNDATGVFGRDSDGNIRFYDSEEPKLTTTVANATYETQTSAAGRITGEVTRADGAYAPKSITPDGGAQAVGKGRQVLHASDYASLTAALGAATAGTTVILTGTATTTGVTIPDDVTLQGQGRATITMQTGGAGYVVTLGNRSRLTGVTLDVAEVSGKSGLSIPASKADAVVENVRIINGSAAAGFYLLGCVRATLVNCSTVGVKWGVAVNSGASDCTIIGGSHVNGTATATAEASLYVPNAARTRFIGVNVISAKGHGATVLSSATDTRFTACTFRGCGTQGGTDYRGASIAANVVGVRFTDCEFLDNYENGAYVVTGAREVDFIGCLMRGNNTGLRPGGHGVEHLGTGKVQGCLLTGQLGNAAGAGCGVYVGSGGTSVIGCDVVGNWSAGVRVVNSSNAIIANNRVRNNSQRGASLSDGIEVLGLTANATQNVTVTGNRCFDDQGTKTQRYGISFDAGGSTGVDNYICTGNNANGNATGAIKDGTNTNKVVANNLGAVA